MKKIEKLLLENPIFTPSVVAYFIIDGQVLLGLRKKVSMGLGENLIAGVGGKVEEGETVEEALKREVFEEISVSVTLCREMGKVHFLFPDRPDWQQEMTIFIVEEWEDEAKESKVILPMWVPINDLPEDQMWDDNLYWLPFVLKGKRVNGTFLYDTKGNVDEYILEVEDENGQMVAE